MTGSLSAQTMTGACPPSSMIAGFMTCAASPARCLPTGIEPVNATNRIAGSGDQVLGDLGGSPKTRFRTPGRQPGLLEAPHELARRPGTSSDALMTMRAAGRQRRGDLAHRRACGEVPRRERRDRPDRLAVDGEQRLVVGGDHASVRAAALLGVPLQELRDAETPRRVPRRAACPARSSSPRRSGRPAGADQVCGAAGGSRSARRPASRARRRSRAPQPRRACSRSARRRMGHAARSRPPSPG